MVSSIGFNLPTRIEKRIYLEKYFDNKEQDCSLFKKSCNSLTFLQSIIVKISQKIFGSRYSQNIEDKKKAHTANIKNFITQMTHQLKKDIEREYSIILKIIGQPDKKYEMEVIDGKETPEKATEEVDKFVAHLQQLTDNPYKQGLLLMCTTQKCKIAARAILLDNIPKAIKDLPGTKECFFVLGKDPDSKEEPVTLIQHGSNWDVQTTSTWKVRYQDRDTDEQQYRFTTDMTIKSLFSNKPKIVMNVTKIAPPQQTVEFSE